MYSWFAHAPTLIQTANFFYLSHIFLIFCSYLFINLTVQSLSCYTCSIWMTVDVSQNGVKTVDYRDMTSYPFVSIDEATFRSCRDGVNLKSRDCLPNEGNHCISQNEIRQSNAQIYGFGKNLYVLFGIFVAETCGLYHCCCYR